MERGVRITRLGHSLPGRPVDQERFTDWLAARLAPGADERRLRRFAERCGVEHRHVVLDLENGEADRFYPVRDGARPRHEAVSAIYVDKAPALAAAAVRAACGGDPQGISHLVVATCTGAVAPGLDILLARDLGLSRSVRRTVVGFMGCYAAVPALRIARDTCLADPAARVLVVCCELSSLHLEPGPRDESLIAACLFADGAGAALVEADGGAEGGLRLGGDFSLVGDDDGSAMAWSAGSHGFNLSLSPAVVRGIACDLMPLATALAPTGARTHDWFVHPGGPRIIDTFERRLELGAGALDRSRRALAKGGNRSSATLMAMLSDAVDEDWRGNGALVGFGPGLTVDALQVSRS